MARNKISINSELPKLIKTFNIIIKKCYRIVWSVGKIQKVKIEKLEEQKNVKIMLLSKCEMCDSKNSKFIKKQEASGLLSSLGIKFVQL